MQLIRERQTHHREEYSLNFDDNTLQGAGFSFPCDKDGNVLIERMHETGIRNLERCRSGEYDVTPRGVVDYSYDYTEPAVGLCDSCERRVELSDPMTNECEHCGALYNGSGQGLAPRHQWEEQIEAEPGVIPGVDDFSGYV
jgi:hypothetical protein